MIDLTGERFGSLVAIRPTDLRSSRGGVMWECRCDCGKDTLAGSYCLRRGFTRSCGCLKSRSMRESRKALTFIDGTCIQYIRERAARQDNKTGVTGVHYESSRYRYCAYITLRGTRYFLGYFGTCEEAAQARRAGEAVLFEPFLARYDDWQKHDEAWKAEHPFSFEVPDTDRVRRAVEGILMGGDRQSVS